MFGSTTEDAKYAEKGENLNRTDMNRDERRCGKTSSFGFALPEYLDTLARGVIT